jgi:hypothetical protein
LTLAVKDIDSFGGQDGSGLLLLCFFKEKIKALTAMARLPDPVRPNSS